MDTKSFGSAIEQICEEKGIAKEKVLETIEMALAAAYKKDYGHKGQNIKVNFNLGTGKMKVFQIKLVVDESMLKTEEEIEEETDEEIDELEKKIRFNPEKHIMINEVPGLKEISEEKKKKIKVGDEIKFPLKVHEDFGRIAAQTAKQVIIQRIREAEREAVYDNFKEKEGQIVSGVIQRIENNNVFLDIGKALGIIFPEEQIPREHYQIGNRLRAYILEVQKESRGPTIILSRAHPKMVSQLFALEVPEISAGTVETKSIAREAGSRTKIAVASTEERVDPIGSMIGQKGTRVQTVINELAGEKIDIVEWSQDPTKFISQALLPAKTLEVKIIDQEKQQAEAVVPEDQLSLAIGIKGQNVRLAAKLTGWKIDIISKKPSSKKEKTEAKESKEKKDEKKTKKAKTEKKDKDKKEKNSDKKKKAEKSKKTTKKETKKSDKK